MYKFVYKILEILLTFKDDYTIISVNKSIDCIQLIDLLHKR